MGGTGVEEFPQFPFLPLPRPQKSPWVTPCRVRGDRTGWRLREGASSPLLGPITLLSCPTSPENSMGDSLCPHVRFAGIEVMTEGDARP